MPSLLRYEPSGAVFSPVTLAQYRLLVAALKANGHVSEIIESSNGGSCSAQGVDLLWTYDGAESLHVVIRGKHGLIVSRMPNSTIFEHLNDEFSKYLGLKG
jgi:hypothetical protein